MSRPRRPSAGAPAPALACLRCGYDLSGHPTASANCPECGLSAALSLTPGDELWHAPPAWLAALAWGTGLVAGVLALSFPVGRLVSQRLALWSFELSVAFDMAMAAAFAAGVWMLTLPQSRFGPPRRRGMLRALAVSPLVWIALNYVFSRGGAGWPPALGPRVLVSFAAVACVVPIPALLFLHLRHLAVRLHRPRLADHCDVVGAGATASLVGVAWLQNVRAPAAVELATTGSALLFCAWSLYLLARFAVAFGRARRQSAAAWRTVEGGAERPAGQKKGQECPVSNLG